MTVALIEELAAQPARKPKPISPKRLAANRKNAKKSTGPRTSKAFVHFARYERQLRNSFLRLIKEIRTLQKDDPKPREDKWDWWPDIDDKPRKNEPTESDPIEPKTPAAASENPISPPVHQNK